MFTDLLLNPNLYNKEERKEKLKTISADHLIFKNGFKGFNYSILEKYKLLDPNNKKYFSKYLNNIKMPVYEVLSYNIPTKFYLDCEMEDIPKDIYLRRNDIFLKFNKALLDFLNKKYPGKEKEILYADSSRLKNDSYKISIHVIVNKLGYFQRNYLKKLVLEFSESLPKSCFFKNGKSFVDCSVYRGSQLMRIIYSHNLNNDSILKPFIIENNEIINKDIEYISNDYEKSLCANYHTYKNDEIIGINYNEKSFQDNIKNNLFKKNKNSDNTHDIPEWKINWIKNNVHIKNIYEIDNIYKNKINLKRIQKNAYCRLCNRNHDNDNGFIRVTDNNLIFYCNRNNKGVCIGSWYENKNKKPNYEDEINILKKENSSLKEKIIILENKLNSFDVFNKIEISKHTKKEYINKNKNLFTKYYEAGLSLINNDIDSFNKIIKNNFNCVNISLLKNRAIRIYDLYMYKKENNLGEIKCSLRNIFNTPNWKFTENLKNKVFFI